ncbi:MAG TPA: type VI secretion system ATPase TssH [Verrucomicrobiae bacterium]|jgi:type VI secretion system protein VasG|nr:type VI secretion system ATPase TssH [Verrucomicrobiae bacterium]
MTANLKGLVGKLNDTTRNALEAAAGFCLARTHYDIEVEHFLLKLLDATDSDFSRILKQFGVDRSRLTGDLMRSLDKLKSGNARTPSFSPSLTDMLSEAWTIGSIDFGSAQVRTGFSILAIASSGDLSRLMREITREFQKISAETLHKDFWNIVAGSPEDQETAQAVPIGVAGLPQGAAGIPAAGKQQNLNQFTIDLTANAKAGKIDAVLGRDHEIRQIIDILTRRRQNNPILTGEAGVGKTAVVEGFALRVAAGDVPPVLKNVTIRSLDLALLQAGAGVKGEFENRLKGLIEEVKSSPSPIILFIDEAHTMIGAGGPAGQGDAANLLKPALARGELRTIAATTWSEYKKFFEKDAALARRFQVVKVEEPTEEQCMVMLRGIVSSLEKHHNVRILDEAVRSATKFSHRYLAGRQLPDKAVSVMDTACARLSLGQNATPPLIEDAMRQVDDLDVQQRVLERETAVGVDHSERLANIAKQRTEVAAHLKTLEERRGKELSLVTRIRDIRTQLEAAVAPALTTPAAMSASAGTAAQPATDATALRAELEKLNAELDALQGDSPLMRVCVDAQIVGEVISAWTGIPVGKMQQDEINTILHLKDLMAVRVIGQNHALEAIAQRISTNRAGMDDPVKPVGVFMLVGPSGVGKTETALALADFLYGGERNLITINMSEFQEAHTVSSLKGAPPGYVGYGEGGVLTEAVRRRPYSVVLLDECEKAHPDVLELFYQVFDKGNMEDGEGREIDFKNTIIILTSNACTDLLMKLTADPETTPSAEGLAKALKPELNKIFKPAFMGRLVTVPYFPLRDEAMKQIVTLKLAKIQRRIRENHKIELTYDPAVVAEVAKRCTEVESGARNVDNILTNTMLPDVSRYLLSRMAERQKPAAIHVSVAENGVFAYS